VLAVTVNLNWLVPLGVVVWHAITGFALLYRNPVLRDRW
jgi:hypothetical protein